MCPSIAPRNGAEGPVNLIAVNLSNYLFISPVRTTSFPTFYQRRRNHSWGGYKSIFSLCHPPAHKRRGSIIGIPWRHPEMSPANDLYSFSTPLAFALQLSFLSLSRRKKSFLLSLSFQSCTSIAAPWGLHSYVREWSILIRRSLPSSDPKSSPSQPFFEVRCNLLDNKIVV